ncbi:MAG: tRNA threonylcarbamoyladenosine dehydratase [Clostridiales bacterium]|nr:tRNA threonylcarbamoyladenosine dehydratase [Clostridiales bacterium]
MSDKFLRTEMLIGKENLEKIGSKKIAVFGIGGVGGYVVEALVRSGIKHIDLYDNDIVSESNINRQIIATTKTIGKLKVDVMEERILEINPEVKINKFPIFYLPENADRYPLKNYDYIVDAIDTVKAKIELIVRANKENIKIISSMGTGNKLNPTEIEVTDINKTEVCPLAKVIRKELRKQGIKKLKVVYSKEEPKKIDNENYENVPASISFVPSVAGLIIASEVIKDIINE